MQLEYEEAWRQSAKRRARMFEEVKEQPAEEIIEVQSDEHVVD